MIPDVKSEPILNPLWSVHWVSDTLNFQRHGLWFLTNSSKGNKPPKEVLDSWNKDFWGVLYSSVSHEIVIHQFTLQVVHCCVAVSGTVRGLPTSTAKCSGNLFFLMQYGLYHNVWTQAFQSKAFFTSLSFQHGREHCSPQIYSLEMRLSHSYCR